MTDKPTCPLCPPDRRDRHIHDQGYVCAHCGRELVDELGLVAGLAGEAETTVAQLDHIGQTGGRAPVPVEAEPRAPGALAPMPLPVDLDAGEQHDAAVAELRTWARHVSDESGRSRPIGRTWLCTHVSCEARYYGQIVGPRCAGEPLEHPTAIIATWLAGQVEWLRHRPEGPEAFRAIREACRAIERVVDRPADRWYAGACTCGVDLWPTAGVKTVRCGTCGAEYDPDDRKDLLLRQAEDTWATAAWCSHFLTSLGVACTPEVVRGYAHRGRLAPHPDPDAMGYPRYRLGSVRELVLATQAEQKERTLRAAVKAAELAERRRQRDARRVAAGPLDV